MQSRKKVTKKFIILFPGNKNCNKNSDFLASYLDK